MDNAFLTHILSAVVSPARVWRVIVVPIGLNSVRAISAAVARDLVSDSPLSKLRNYGESEMGV